jgi:prepilin-type N-terminal cleavage/methylation domain-containing protein
MLRSRFQRSAAFTLMELMTVVVIIGILAAMVFGVVSDVQYRADRSTCIGNLKALYTGSAVYIQEQGHWPQIDPQLLVGNDKAYASAWIDALSPCGVAKINWICPSVQRLMHNPDITKPNNLRVDYMATPFDEKSITPYLWPKQPWFVERGSVHGGGNLLIWTNGQVVSLKEAMSYK